MRKCLGILVVVAIVASPAWATVSFKFPVSGPNSRTYTSNLLVKMNGYVAPNWQGGAFEAQVTPGTITSNGQTATLNGWISGLVGDKDPGIGQKFNTFCIESQTANLGWTKYVATIETWAADGDQDLGVNPNDGIDPLSGATAWLYRQYLAGNLSGYTNQAISEALWYLEDEVKGVNSTSNNLVENAQANAYGSDLGGVRVLNLWTLTWNTMTQQWEAVDIQSQLVAVPAPGAALLAVLGLGLVGWIKKRLA